MMSPRIAALGFALAIGCFATPLAAVRGDALERLTAAKLAAVRADVEKYRDQRRDVVRGGPLRDYRANLHVHSKFSHDSRGQLDEIVRAAQRAGTNILMFSEHPAEHYDFVVDGHQGLREGVLLIPGAETKGLLAYPRHSVRGLEGGSTQEFCEIVRNRGGLAFLSHLEERLDLDVRGLTGVEIYNTHADFKDEKRLASSLRNPLWLFSAAELVQKYPQESLSALQDYPATYLRRWDELCQGAPHTGVSANDAHQNVGVKVRLADDNIARVESALEEKLLDLDASTLVGLLPKLKEAKVGDVVFELQLDRYEYSLRHVGTHLLLPELSQAEVWKALEAGRAFVAFDWIADARGFDCRVVAGDTRHELGSQLKFEPGLRLVADSPLAAHWKLIRNGQTLDESNGAKYERELTEPGIYRLEGWLDVGGERRVWILTNPFYLR